MWRISTSGFAGISLPRVLNILIGLLLCPALEAQVQVRVAPVIQAVITEQLPLSGSIHSPRSSDLSTQESGLVVAMAVESGDRVAAGDVLLQLDGEATRLELERLLARREEAELALGDAKRLADEGRRLIDDRNISRTQYESRLAAEAQEEARLRQLDSQVRLQRLKLDRHTLRAPFSGVIGTRHAELGEWLSAGTSAMRLVQVDPLRIQASIPERYFSEVGAGTRVSISVDAWPGQSIDVEVENVIMVADQDTRSFTARVDVPNADRRLAPGMSAHMVFHLGDSTSRPVLQVPADAVVRRSDGKAVVWVVRDGRAEAVPVRIGRRSGGNVEVSADGLAENDQVVTLGNESLRPGQEVQPAGR